MLLSCIIGNCSTGEYYSLESSRCIPNKQLCDDQRQTDRGDDEAHCCKNFSLFITLHAINSCVKSSGLDSTVNKHYPRSTGKTKTRILRPCCHEQVWSMESHLRSKLVVIYQSWYLQLYWKWVYNFQISNSNSIRRKMNFNLFFH